MKWPWQFFDEQRRKLSQLERALAEVDARVDELRDQVAQLRRERLGD